MNYESEFGDILQNSLKSLYQIYDENVLYRYLYLRFLIEHNDIKLDSWNQNLKMVEFVLKELNIPTIDNYVIYRECLFSKTYANKNSLESIIINWHFRASLSVIRNIAGIELKFDDYIKKEYSKIIRHGKNKAKTYRKTQYYQLYLKLNSIELLNKIYCVNIGNPSKIEHVKYPEGHNFFARTAEEAYISEKHSVEFLTKNTNTISENTLEKFLIRNLSIIEEGMQYIQSQYLLKDGRIDILARDKNKSYVIIELKVKEDKEILYQCLYYPEALKNEIGEKVPIRMMVIAPDYSEHILIAFRKIEDIELFKFEPIIELGKIKDLKLTKI